MESPIANKPGKSMSQINHERSCFQMIAIRARIADAIPKMIVSMPEKTRKPVNEEMNSTVNKADHPTAHHPSRVCGIPVNFP